MGIAGWARRARQNAIDPRRPIASLARWPGWLVACARDREVTLRFATGGLRMRVTPRLTAFGTTALAIRRDAYEPELLAVRRFVRPGAVAIDIGASFGVFALFLSEYAGPGGRVHAFEPGAFSHAALARNVALNARGDRIVTHRIAAAAVSATLRLHHLGGSPVNFSLGATADPFEEVPAARVDAIVPAADWPRVGFVKIDVEGYERFALEGARGVIERARPVILFEVSAPALARVGDTPAALFGHLAGHGYRFARFTAAGALEPVRAPVEGNLIAIPAGHPDAPPG